MRTRAYAKSNYSFSYVLPCISYNKKIINNVPSGIKKRLGRISNLCILDLNITLNIVSVVVDVVICIKTSLYVVIHLLALSPKRNISLKQNLMQFRQH